MQGIGGICCRNLKLAEIRLPAELTAESYARNRDYEIASAKLNEIMPQIQALLEESKIKIAEAEAQGVDLNIYRKRKGGRGEAKFFTKVEKDRRVELEWNSAGQPIGPGSWGILFHEAIGCLVRRSDLWEVAFTFTSNEYSSFKNTWLQLLRYYVLEDDIDGHWTYVRNEMHNKFKHHCDRLKKKYIKSDKYEEDWQRICGMPSNIREESFAYLLIHWGTKYAQDESARNSANRMKGADLYFGGSVKGSQYRSYVDMAGGDASLSTSWQVLHTKPDMPEEQLGTQREHWENIAEAERLYRESNPEYPATQSMLPIDVETNIIEHEFPHSAGKGYFPLLGQAPSSRSRTSSSTSRADFEYSQTARQIHYLQEQVQHEQEERTRMQEQLDREREERTRMQEQINYLMQRQSQPSYDPQYEAFLAWQRAQGGGGGGAGAGGSGFT